ncbi:RHS repeat domain-containing protein, partial [Pseudomonas cichorii]|uniref:RHS repeat domain-containing protein n=1 Tax=Pseudomonas cichorii TaxID=36746 RepID=UPI0019103E4E
AGNLLQMRHVGAQSFTRTMRVAKDSNRSLPDGEVDVEFDTGFDANGNLLQLVRGQTLDWDVRNQLQQITTVTRATQASDNERYIYDGQGQRCRKINSTLASSRTLNNEVRYLPGLEIRTTADGEALHVINAQAGRGSVRVLHWQAGQPSGIANDQIRYSLSDHLGSSTLELDQQGGLISQESYYPFGGTSWWAAHSAVEAKYKTVRYSGKECDASGLYYYGFRYYAPWLQRWINPDPAGDINGLNIFCFVANMPVLHNDLDGRLYEGTGDIYEQTIVAAEHTILFRGLNEFNAAHREHIRKAFIKVHKIYENALYMITYHPHESADIMRSFFGARHKEITGYVAESWRRIYLRAAEYRGELGKDKILGINPANNRLSAFVLSGDPLGRIVIDARNITEKRLTIMFGHELSHLHHASGSIVIGPSTADYYYLFGQNISDEEGNVWHDLYRAVAEKITSGHLNSEYLLNDTPSATRIEKRIKSLHSEPNTITDLNAAVEAFNQDPNIIAIISANNADSIFQAARHLHKLFKRNILPTLQAQRA